MIKLIHYNRGPNFQMSFNLTNAVKTKILDTASKTPPPRLKDCLASFSSKKL